LLAFILLLVLLKRWKTAREEDGIVLPEHQFPEIEVPETEGAVRIEQLRNLAEKETEHVAYLLKTWLKED
jgi:flagellar biosynthesis/type III secretory pathway M-ring protein FliF/YscJ